MAAAAAYTPMRINYNPVTTWTGTAQTNAIGVQSAAGFRGSVPVFTDNHAVVVNGSNAGVLITSDTSGAGNPLVVSGGSTLAPQTPTGVTGGRVGTANFSDTSYFQANSRFNIAFGGLTAFTIEGWVWFTDTSNANKVVFNFGNGSGANGTYIQLKGTTGLYSIGLAVNGSVLCTSPQSISNTGWNYVVVTYAAAGNAYIYAGATPSTVAQVATAAGVGAVSAANLLTYVGRYFSVGSSFTSGVLASMVVSNVVQSAFPTASTAAGVIAYWPMIQGGSDVSGVGNGSLETPYASMKYAAEVNPPALGGPIDWGSSAYAISISGATPQGLKFPDDYGQIAYLTNYTNNLAMNQPPIGNTMGYVNGATLTTPSGLNTAIAGLTAITVEAWVWYNGTFSAAQFVYSGNSTVQLFVSSGGTAQANINGSVITASINLPQFQWVYMAVTYTSGATNGVKLWQGTSAETAVVVASTTVTGALGSATATIGSAAGSTLWKGFINRVNVSKVDLSLTANGGFPAKLASANTLACFNWGVAPPIVKTQYSYLGVTDSGLYRGDIRCSYKYDTPNFAGVYSADGTAPTVQVKRGTLPNSFGPNSQYAQPYAGSLQAVYVDGTLGNDGTAAAGNAALPAQTISKALTLSAGGPIVIVRSGTYIENLTITTNCIILALPGVQAVLQPASSSYHLNVTTTSTIQFFNMTFGRNASTSLIGNASGGSSAITFNDCNVIGYAQLIDTTITTAYVTFNRCGFTNVLDVSNTTPTNTLSMAFYDSNFTGSTIAFTGIGTTAFPYYAFIFDGCSFNYTQLISHVAPVKIVRCSFYKASLVGSAGGRTGVVNSVFAQSYINISAPASASANITGIYGVTQTGYGLGVNGISLAVATSGTGYAVVSECIAIGNTLSNFNLQQAGTGSVYAALSNCTSLNGTVDGFNLAAGILTSNLLDYGSTTAYAGGATFPTTAQSNATFVSASPGAEVATLVAGSTGVFNGYGTQLDNGCDLAGFQFGFGKATTFSGFTVSSPFYQSPVSTVNTNVGGGLLYDYTAYAVTISYCTFSGLAWGVNLPNFSTVQNCYFTTAAHGIKTVATLGTIQNNIGFQCGGAWLMTYSGGNTIQYNSTWGCAYGEYDSPQTHNTVNTANIYAGSSLYDFSGNDTLTYSCVGTIDVNSFGTVDAKSTRLDPLYVNIATGDLRLSSPDLSALAAFTSTTFFFTSPASKTGPGGVDMGAIAMTHGTSSTVWTLIDFSNTDSTGPVTGPYRNPDSAPRQDKAIHLGEGDMENMIPFSIMAGTAPEIVLTWNPDSNPMPTAQFLALKAMFDNNGNAYNNKIQIDLGGMPGFAAAGVFQSAYIVRSNGFTWDDMSKAISYTGMPTPVHQITVRVV